MDSIIKRKIRSVAPSGQIIEITLRGLDEACLEGMRGIASESFEKSWTAEEFNYFIKHPSGCSVGAFIGQELVGYFLALLAQGELDIVSIAVKKTLRRCSVAENMMDYVMKLPDVTTSFLEVDESNLGAIRLYEKLGFKRYGLRKKYYNGKKDAVLMKYPL